MLFRKLPVEIEAFQVPESGEPQSKEMIEFLYRSVRTITSDMDCLAIHTLEGVMHASPGDWIIKGIKGEYYPCKPDIFEQTYEPVEG